MQIRTGDTFDPRVIALLDYHRTSAAAQTAPGSAHALDLSWPAPRRHRASGPAGTARRWLPPAR